MLNVCTFPSHLPKASFIPKVIGAGRLLKVQAKLMLALPPPFRSPPPAPPTAPSQHCKIFTSAFAILRDASQGHFKVIPKLCCVWKITEH